MFKKTNLSIAFITIYYKKAHSILHACWNNVNVIRIIILNAVRKVELILFLSQDIKVVNSSSFVSFTVSRYS